MEFMYKINAKNPLFVKGFFVIIREKIERGNNLMTRKILEMINRINDEQELRYINKNLIERLKHLRKLQGFATKNMLAVGMKVNWSGKRGYQEGEIIKINRTRALVKSEYETWNVSMSMLKIM